VGDDQVEQRPNRLARHVRVERGRAEAGVRVDDREVDLRLVGVLVEEERVHLVDDLGDARVGPVDLVHDQDDGEPSGERLAQHEPRLRQRPFARVDEQQDAVHHGEAALDLAAEIRVPRRVDDVDLHVAEPHGGVLREDGDAPLALEARVHHAVDGLLVLREGARLAQEGVDERRLAVVDVGDDRDVPDVLAGLHVAGQGSDGSAV